MSVCEHPLGCLTLGARLAASTLQGKRGRDGNPDAKSESDCGADLGSMESSCQFITSFLILLALSLTSFLTNRAIGQRGLGGGSI